jgi:hypothetical protein
VLKLLLFLAFTAAMIGLGAFGALHREGLKADFMAKAPPRTCLRPLKEAYVILTPDCEKVRTDIAGRHVRTVLANSLTESIECEQEMSR